MPSQKVQVKKHKANFANIPPNQKFHGKKCVLGISTKGQEKHRGENFHAIMDLINKSEFSEVIVLIGDCIQRFTLAIDKNDDPDKFRREANDLGKSWYAEHSQEVSGCTVIYCDAIVKNEKTLFNEFKNRVDLLIAEDSENGTKFRTALNNSAEKFILRYKRRLEEDHEVLEDEGKAKELCKKYILEECAILCVLAIKYGPDYFAYPSEINAFEVTRELILDNRYLEWLDVKVKPDKRIEPANNNTPSNEIKKSTSEIKEKLDSRSNEPIVSGSVEEDQEAIRQSLNPYYWITKCIIDSVRLKEISIEEAGKILHRVATDGPAIQPTNNSIQNKEQTQVKEQEQVQIQTVSSVKISGNSSNLWLKQSKKKPLDSDTSSSLSTDSEEDSYNSDDNNETNEKTGSAPGFGCTPKVADEDTF